MLKVPSEVLLFELPEGYELYEDLEFLYLKAGEKIIAKFPLASATPSVILKAIKEQRQENLK